MEKRNAYLIISLLISSGQLLPMAAVKTKSKEEQHSKTTHQPYEEFVPAKTYYTRPKQSQSTISQRIATEAKAVVAASAIQQASAQERKTVSASEQRTESSHKRKNSNASRTSSESGYEDSTSNASYDRIDRIESEIKDAQAQLTIAVTQKNAIVNQIKEGSTQFSGEVQVIINSVLPENTRIVNVLQGEYSDALLMDYELQLKMDQFLSHPDNLLLQECPQHGNIQQLEEYLTYVDRKRTHIQLEAATLATQHIIAKKEESFIKKVIADSNSTLSSEVLSKKIADTRTAIKKEYFELQGVRAQSAEIYAELNGWKKWVFRGESEQKKLENQAQASKERVISQEDILKDQLKQAVILDTLLKEAKERELRIAEESRKKLKEISGVNPTTPPVTPPSPKSPALHEPTAGKSHSFYLHGAAVIGTLYVGTRNFSVLKELGDTTLTKLASLLENILRKLKNLNPLRKNIHDFNIDDFSNLLLLQYELLHLQEECLKERELLSELEKEFQRTKDEDLRFDHNKYERNEKKLAFLAQEIKATETLIDVFIDTFVNSSECEKLYPYFYASNSEGLQKMGLEASGSADSVYSQIKKLRSERSLVENKSTSLFYAVNILNPWKIPQKELNRLTKQCNAKIAAHEEALKENLGKKLIAERLNSRIQQSNRYKSALIGGVAVTALALTNQMPKPSVGMCAFTQAPGFIGAGGAVALTEVVIAAIAGGAAIVSEKISNIFFKKQNNQIAAPENTPVPANASSASEQKNKINTSAPTKPSSTIPNNNNTLPDQANNPQIPSQVNSQPTRMKQVIVPFQCPNGCPLNECTHDQIPTAIWVADETPQEIEARKKEEEAAERQRIENNKAIVQRLEACVPYIGLTFDQLMAQAMNDPEAFDKATKARNERFALGNTGVAPAQNTLTKIDKQYWQREEDYQHHIQSLEDYAASLEQYDDDYSRKELAQVRATLEIAERLIKPIPAASEKKSKTNDKAKKDEKKPAGKVNEGGAGKEEGKAGDKEQDLGAQAPGKPTKEDGYEPPKNWNGEKVKTSKGYGYPDKNGNIWIPTGPTGHGGPHWDVQRKGGGYNNVYPGGKIRPGKK